VFSVGGAAGNAQPSANPQLAMSKPAVAAEEPLLAEIKAFLQAVRDRSRPVVALEDGRPSSRTGPGDSGGDCSPRQPHWSGKALVAAAWL